MRALSESWLNAEQAMGGRSVLNGNAAEMREQFSGLMAAVAPHAPPLSGNVETKDTQAGSVPVRIYTPKNAAGPLPVGIYAHGGGYVLGSVKDENLVAYNVSELAHVIMVSVDYRLAPESKAPAQLDDMVEAADWVAANASSFGGDPDKLFTMGTSAGGGLALSLARKIKIGQTKVDPKALKGVSAMVPVSLHPDHVPDRYDGRYNAYKDNEKNVPVIDKASMMSFYKETGVSPTDESYFTALDSASFSKFPPTAIVTCEFDPLRDDGKIVVEELQKAGVPTKLDHWDGFPHCFWLIPGLSEGATFFQNLIGNLEWIKSQM